MWACAFRGCGEFFLYPGTQGSALTFLSGLVLVAKQERGQIDGGAISLGSLPSVQGTGERHTGADMPPDLNSVWQK